MLDFVLSSLKDEIGDICIYSLGCATFGDHRLKQKLCVVLGRTCCFPMWPSFCCSPVFFKCVGSSVGSPFSGVLPSNGVWKYVRMRSILDDILTWVAIYYRAWESGTVSILQHVTQPSQQGCPAQTISNTPTQGACFQSGQFPLVGFFSVILNWPIN